MSLVVLFALVGLAPGAPAQRAVETTIAQATRSVTVWVGDPDRQPVAGAGVEVISGFRPIAAGTTDGEGKAVIAVPSEAAVQWIVALKPGAGFDSMGCDPESSDLAEEYPPAVRGSDLLDEVTLTLDGARTIRVKAVDQAGAPLPGVRLSPWMMQAAGDEYAVNLSGSLLASATTDEGGEAIFDWIPSRAGSTPGATFVVHGDEYHWPDPPEGVFAGVGDLDVTAHMVKKTAIRGQVRFPDGSPAAGMTVLAQGRGKSVHFGRGESRTSQDGRYSIAVAPEQTYTVTVIDPEWAARRDGVSAPAGAPVDGADLELGRGALIRGRIVSPEQTPVPGEFVYLAFEDPRLSDGLRLAEDDFWCGFEFVSLHRHVATDAQGRFAFRVAPGRYQVCTPAAIVHRDWDRREGDIHSPVKVEIDAETPRAVDLEFTQRRSRPLAASLAPVKANEGHVYEFAFQPAAQVEGDGGGSCTQCHGGWLRRQLLDSAPRAHGWR